MPKGAPRELERNFGQGGGGISLIEARVRWVIGKKLFL